jgi:hypothetical protein
MQRLERRLPARPRGVLRERAVGVVALLAAAAACGSHAASCPTTAPPCPSSPPSFVADVNPIIQNTCVPCHGPGGVEANRPYVTYEDMKTYGPFVTMYSQVLGCLMPEPPQALTTAQRQLLLEWFACGEPDDRAAVDGGVSPDGATD